QCDGSGSVAAAERHAHRGGDGPVDPGQSAVPHDEAVLVRWVRGRHEVEVAYGVRGAGDEGGVGPDRGGDLAGDVECVQLRQPTDELVHPEGEVLVGGTPGVQP